MSRADAPECDVCQSHPGTHNFDIVNDSGGGAVHTCETCTELALKLAEAVKQSYCMWCLTPTNDKYIWTPYGEPTEATHRICAGCRHDVEFTDEAIEAEPLGDLFNEPVDGVSLENWPVPYNPDGETVYDEHGNPIPSPLDECDGCGTRRHERPDGFAPEIMTPYGEAEYLCKLCREQGRGMK